MVDPRFNWPTKGNRAFGPSVSSDDLSQLDAFVFPSDGTFVAGFQRAADMVVAGAKGGDLNPDDLFFPVAYLYRHHLELMLKELVRVGVRVGFLSDCKDLLVGHNLHKLWNKARELIVSAWPDSPREDIWVVEQVILEFHQLDPTGQAFRYSRDRDGVSHDFSGLQRVDLIALKSTVDAVSRFLDAACTGVDACDPGPP